MLLNPIVLIEVLSPSTERYERNVKFPHYLQMPSVREILLVLQDAPTVEHYRRQVDGQFALSMVQGLDKAVVLESIDCRFAMQDIYGNVEFPANPFGIVVP